MKLRTEIRKRRKFINYVIRYVIRFKRTKPYSFNTVCIARELYCISKLFTYIFAVGRKIDFLIQEMNREINTIGSKSNNLEIARIVLDVKAEIEKLREQIQNVE